MPEQFSINEKTFYSNGKLLITGEYLVLDGATAFALLNKNLETKLKKVQTTKYHG
jgi:hypothetical protein